MKLLTRMPASFFPFFHQEGVNDCGNACLRMVAKYYGIDYQPSVEEIRRFTTPNGINMLQLTQAIQEIGLYPRPMRGKFCEFMKEAVLPCIAFWEQRHFVVVFDANERYIQIADPAQGKKVLNHQEFVNKWENLGSTPKEGIIVIVDDPHPS